MADENSASQDRGTFVPLIFGGAVATALGFFAGQLEPVEAWLGLESNNGLAAVVEEQAATLEAQAGTIEALTARLEEVATSVPEMPEIPEVDLSGVTSDIEAKGTEIAALAERVTEVEKRPMTEGLSEKAIAAYEAELTRLQDAVATQRAEIEAILTEARDTEMSAEQKAKLALARTAMSEIIAAVDSGEPFSDAVTELSGTGAADVPATLSDLAASGVPTQSALEDAFPDAARAALATARSSATGGGFGSFLQNQLGARSVTPRDGDDADAVLSRAEAALRDGRLADALTEVDALQDDAKAAMADWVSVATTRLAAKAAADELMTALATN